MDKGDSTEMAQSRLRLPKQAVSSLSGTPQRRYYLPGAGQHDLGRTGNDAGEEVL